MSPHNRIYGWSVVSAVAIAGAWLLMRLLLFADFLGDLRLSLAAEIIIALVGGFFLAGIVCAVHESWKNQRDRGAELAELCAKWGFSFSAPANQAELGLLADSPLLQRYTAILSRMSGTVEGHPVELLDVSRWVERHSDTTIDRFEWRHTLVVFPAPTKLPAFILHPLGLTDRYLHAFAGAKGVTFVHGIDSAEDGIRQQFQTQYIVWPGDKSYFASQDDSVSKQTAELGGVFSEQVVTFFAEHPGWCVEVAGGQVALWREDRIVEPAARAALLADAATVYRLLTQRPRRANAALRVVPAKSLDLSHFGKIMIWSFIGIAVGIWFGFFVGCGVLVLLLRLFPDPPGWFPIIVFPVLILGGMLLGAYVGFRIVRRFF